MEEVTDEMILDWEKAINYIYKRSFSKNFAHMKDDLLQWGRYGVYIAYKNYNSTDVEKNVWLEGHIWQYIRGFMGHCVRNEFRHNTNTFSYDLSTINDNTKLSHVLKIDLERAINLLNSEYRDVVIKRMNDFWFGEMGCSSERTACHKYHQAIKKLKELLKNEP